MDIFSQMAESIIKEQQEIIGPVALEQAKKVNGLTVNLAQHEIAFSGNKTEILEQLVEKYKDVFGQASVEVCKDAVKGILSKLPHDQVPALLK